MNYLHELSSIIDLGSKVIITVLAVHGARQYKLYQKNTRLENLFKVWQPLLSNPEILQFREIISRIVKNLNKPNIGYRIEVLNNLKLQIDNEHKTIAKIYRDYLIQIFYLIDIKLISVEDFLQIHGEWIFEYYKFREYLKSERNHQEILDLYFPEIPVKLLRILKQKNPKFNEIKIIRNSKSFSKNSILTYIKSIFW